MMPKTIKLSLSILLFLCLVDMSYGCYQLIRFITLIGFSMLAHNKYNEGKSEEAIIYLVLALLFQPFFKVALDRELWIIIDVIVGLFLLMSIWIEMKQDNKAKSIEKRSIDENYYSEHNG